MAKKRNLKNKWFAFVPFLNILYIGRLTGDCLVFGRKMKRAGLYVMIAQVIATVVTAAYVVASTILFVKYGDCLEITSDYSHEWVGLPAQGEWLRRFIWVLDGSGSMIGGVLQITDLAYKILLLVLLMSFFRKYAPRQSLIFSLISCFVPETRYIFIFVLRKNQAINYEDYVRRQREEYMRRRQQSGTPPYGGYGPYGHGPYGPYGYGGTPYGQSNEPKGKAPEDPFAEFGSSTGEKSEQNGGSSNSSDCFFN